MILPAHLIAKRLTSKANHGFTLIELLIVIAILGILAAAVLVAVNPVKRQNQAKDANIKADVGSIATALQAYYTSPGAGTYPVNTDTLVANKDLKQLPAHPDGSAYVYAKDPATCAGTAADPCTEVSLSGALYDKTATEEVWCWRSSLGKASGVTVAAGCPAT